MREYHIGRFTPSAYYITPFVVWMIVLVALAAGAWEISAAAGLAALVTWNTHGADFLPFFYNWEGLYEQGIIDGAEWRANRFHFL